MSRLPELPGSAEDVEPDANIALLTHLYNRFVHLVLYARMGLGRWGPDDELASFTIFLGESPLVRINDEPEVWTTPRARRSFAPGDALEPNDLLTEPAALSETSDRPFISARRHDAGWQVELDLRRANARCAELLATADEFLNTARWALEQGYLRAFAENGFHAAEALARAELLAYPVTEGEVGGSRKHAGALTAYHLWARLGNADRRFPAVLQELLELRGAATYADKKLTFDAETASAQLKILLDMRQHVEQVLSGDKGAVVKVIATRDLRAGELVNLSDATIRPAKTSRAARRS